ncbi:MAG TPA: hypothetical protein ENK44_15310 [Caldithrix abyssi]|uniref:Uncharacterized protein n=1 Tax=Caldithrix abyssi TaxID=187145 RepID=A0A7V4WX19_CALAY|nr:hypothetical protein [Caldithrix abyssi]
MNKKIMETQLERLSERLRILILQNARFESDYDQSFLEEIILISQQMLQLKSKLQHSGKTAFVFNDDIVVH